MSSSSSKKLSGISHFPILSSFSWLFAKFFENLSLGGWVSCKFDFGSENEFLLNKSIYVSFFPSDLAVFLGKVSNYGSPTDFTRFAIGDREMRFFVKYFCFHFGFVSKENGFRRIFHVFCRENYFKFLNLNLKIHEILDFYTKIDWHIKSLQISLILSPWIKIMYVTKNELKNAGQSIIFFARRSGKLPRYCFFLM